MAPNDFVVELGDHDYDRLITYAAQLTTELSTVVSEYGQDQRYMFVGPIAVRFERAPDLATGMFRIRSQALSGSGAPAPGAQMPQAVPGYPPPSPYQQQPVAPGGYPPPPGAGGYPPPQQQGGYPPPPPPQPAAPSYWLEVNGVPQPLNQTVTSIGRGTDVDLRIDDPSVSRRHAEIRIGQVSYVSDLGSTNGIIVDNQHVPQAQLRDGSVIHLGNTTIVFRTGER
jgi:hypothetical protein